MADERGFTLLEVVVATAILALLIVPLTSAFMMSLRQSSTVTDRLGQSHDAQLIAANWNADVAGMDPKNDSMLLGGGTAKFCKNPDTHVLAGTYLYTFLWDQGSAGPGQDALVPKAASWVIEGDALVRRYCQAGVFVEETKLATHLGVDGSDPLATVHGPDVAHRDQFCFSTHCTIIFNGTFTFELTAGRRVAGTDTSLSGLLPAPTITSVTPKNERLSVVWTPPTVPDGAPPITGYLVEAWTSANGAGGAAAQTQIDASTNSADLTGLVNGASYWVVVYTQSASGQGLHSAPFGPVVPGPTVPDVPRTVTAAPGSIASPLAETVSWQAPVDDGGLPIDQYEVQGLRSDGVLVPVVQVSGSTLSTSVTGLAADWEYAWRVRAHSSFGWGSLSDPGSATTRPPMPTNVTATPAGASALVSFVVAGNGPVNMAFTNAVRITATCVVPSASCTDRVILVNHPSPTVPNGTIGPIDTSSGSPSVQLVNGQAYRLTVEILNTVGDWSPPSAPSAPVTPVTNPVAPTAQVSISSPGTTSALQFTIASGTPNGGSPITSYQVTEPGGRALTILAAPDASGSALWDGTGGGKPKFVDFTNYSFTVKACNASGCSAGSTALVAQAGVPPATTTLTLARGAAPRQVNASTTLNPAVTGTSSTAWTFSCPGAANVAGTGTSPAVQLTNVTVGVRTCSVFGLNNLNAVASGAQTLAILAGSSVSDLVDVYDAPGPLQAPTVTLPASGPANNVSVAVVPASPASGGTSPTLTYTATCTTASATRSASSAMSPISVTGLTPGETASCTITATNAAGYSTTSPATAVLLVGAPTKVVFTSQPGGGPEGSVWAAQPVVKVQDVSGVVVPTDASSVTLSINSGPVGGSLSCATNPMAAVAGAASFSGCKISGPAGTYTLKATDGALTQAVSSSFTIVITRVEVWNPVTETLGLLNSGTQTAKSGHIRAFAVIRHAPGVSVTGTRFDLVHASSGGTYGSTNCATTASITCSGGFVANGGWNNQGGRATNAAITVRELPTAATPTTPQTDATASNYSQVFVDITVPNFDSWQNDGPDGTVCGLESGGPRICGDTASFNFQLSDGTFSGDQSFSYRTVARGTDGTGEDYPTNYSTGSTTDQAVVAPNTASAITVNTQCDDNDNQTNGPGVCDWSNMRFRRMGDNTIVNLVCTSAVSASCFANSGQPTTFDQNDTSSRSFKYASPAQGGLWVIEGEFCNENNACPANPPTSGSAAGYGSAFDYTYIDQSGATQTIPGGNDWQNLGSFYVNAAGPSASISSVTQGGTAVGTRADGTLHPNTGATLTFNTSVSADTQLVDWNLNQNNTDGPGAVGYELRAYGAVSYGAGSLAVPTLASDAASQNLNLAGYGSAANCAVGIRAYDTGGIGAGDPSAAAVTAAKPCTTNAVPAGTPQSGANASPGTSQVINLAATDADKWTNAVFAGAGGDEVPTISITQPATGSISCGTFTATSATAGTFPCTYIVPVGATPGAYSFSYTVTDSHNGTSSSTAVSGTIVGPPAKVVFTTQPGGGASGSGWSVQPVVKVQDANGIVIPGDSSPVTLAINSGPTPSTLSCATNPLSASAGVASFSGCKISGPAGTYTLKATDGALTQAVSSSFTIVITRVELWNPITETLGLLNSGTQTAKSGHIRAFAVIRHAPGVSVTGTRFDLVHASSGGTYGSTNCATTASITCSGGFVANGGWNNQSSRATNAAITIRELPTGATPTAPQTDATASNYSQVFVDITVPNYDSWQNDGPDGTAVCGLESGGPRICGNTASFNFQLSDGTFSGDQSFFYRTVARGTDGSGEDYPTNYSTGSTTDQVKVAPNTANAITVNTQCDDNDSTCDWSNMRFRRLGDNAIINLVCSSAGSASCFQNSGQSAPTFDQNDTSSRSFTYASPAQSGLWVIEGEFCNDSGDGNLCPKGPPTSGPAAGYGSTFPYTYTDQSGATQTIPGGNDWQNLGSFYVDAAAPTASISSVTQGGTAVGTRADGTLHPNTDATLAFNTTTSADTQVVDWNLNQNNTDGIGSLGYELRTYGEISYSPLTLGLVALGPDAASQNLNLTGYGSGVNCAVGIRAWDSGGIGAGDPSAAAVTAAKTCTTNAVPTGTAQAAPNASPGTSMPINLAASDADKWTNAVFAGAGGDEVPTVAVVQPAVGSVSCGSFLATSATTGTFPCSYTVPAGTAVGPYSFSYTVTDSHNGTSAPAGVSGTISDTSTAITCVPSPVAHGTASTCTVTVTDVSAAPVAPKGAVAITTSSTSPTSPTVTGSPCTLGTVGAPVNARVCTFTVNSSVTAVVTVTGAYVPSDTHRGSIGSATLTVA